MCGKIFKRVKYPAKEENDREGPKVLRNDLESLEQWFSKSTVR